VEKLVAIKDLVPGLRLVVQTAAYGMRQIEYEWLTSFEAVVDAGMGATMQCDPGDTALLHYATGSGGEVRGVTLTHAELLAAAETLVGRMEVRPTDETLAWLPMAWFGDVLTSQALALSIGFTCNCPENPETARRDLREIGPTILVAPPRIWENTLSDIETRATQASGLKSALFAGFRVIAERAEQHRQAGEKVPLLLQLELALGEALVYAPMRDQIGLRRLRWANTCGEPLAPRVLHSFRAFGINLNQSKSFELAGAVLEPAHA
jgi:long-chain acyl-CoA synthetase